MVKPRTIPGDRALAAASVTSAIRVDHAGEYGAERIYAGQLAMLKGSPKEALIRDMKEQEEKHLHTFDTMIRERHIRPTALLPFWHVGGFMMGAMTAMLGDKAAMACTVAVESVIDEHYRGQLEILPEEEGELKQTIEQFRQEEMEHHDIGLEHGAEQAPLYGLIHASVSGITRAAIWLSTRI